MDERSEAEQIYNSLKEHGADIGSAAIGIIEDALIEARAQRHVRRAAIKVTHELLRDAMALPDNMEGVLVAPDYTDDPMRVALLYVESPDLRPVYNGHEIPVLNVTFTADWDRRPATWITCDLGLEKGKDKPK